ncbi:MAG: hypothetical protein ACI91Z_000511 [Yoonia sp.]
MPIPTAEQLRLREQAREHDRRQQFVRMEAARMGDKMCDGHRRAPKGRSNGKGNQLGRLQKDVTSRLPKVCNQIKV